MVKEVTLVLSSLGAVGLAAAAYIYMNKCKKPESVTTGRGEEETEKPINSADAASGQTAGITETDVEPILMSEHNRNGTEQIDQIDPDEDSVSENKTFSQEEILMNAGNEDSMIIISPEEVDQTIQTIQLK